MRLPALISRFMKGREHRVIVRDPAEFADVIEAQRVHRELLDRADRAVEMAFRHAEEAAAQTGRRPPQRPQSLPAKGAT